MIKRRFMAFVGSLCAAFVLAAASPVALADSGEPYVSPSGIIKVKSAYSVSETIARLKKDVADKGIKFFIEVDQAKLAADAGIKLRPSTLLVFGNPPLGTLFIGANPSRAAGRKWRRVGRVYGLQLHRSPARHPGSRPRGIQEGVRRHCFDHVERESAVRIRGAHRP